MAKGSMVIEDGKFKIVTETAKTGETDKRKAQKKPVRILDNFTAYTLVLRITEGVSVRCHTKLKYYIDTRSTSKTLPRE